MCGGTCTYNVCQVVVGGGGGVVVCVRACVLCMCVCVCVFLFTPLCAWGKGTTKMEKKKGKYVNLEKSTQERFEPATSCLWANCAKPQYYCQVLLLVGVIGGNRVSQSDFLSFLCHSALLMKIIVTIRKSGRLFKHHKSFKSVPRTLHLY